MDSTKTSCDSKASNQPSAEHSRPAGMTIASDEAKTDNDGRPDLTDGWQINLPLGHCMLKLFDEQLWTDVTFRCVDQSEENEENRDGIIRAHKLVLAARSPVFQAMFFGSFQDKNAEIEIRDANSNEFRMFIRLLYSDNLDLYNECYDVVNILKLAHRYQVQLIVEGCCRKLGKNVSMENACRLLDIALLYGNKQLTSEVSNFIDRNAETILMNDDFLKTSLRCLTYIFKGDTFFVNETKIFNRAIEWAEHRCVTTDGMAVRNALGEAFYYLRTPSMTVSEFMACTKRKGYYNVDEIEDVMDIIGSSENYQNEIGCNSSRTRFPHDHVVHSPETNIDNSSVTASDIRITESVTITPTRHFYLTKVELKNRTLDLDTRVQAPYQRAVYKNQHPIKELLNTRLSVNLKLDSTPLLGNSIFLSGDKPFEIRLPKPILLSPGQSYNLDVQMKLEGIANLKMTGCSWGKSQSFSGSSNDTINVKTCTKSAANIIRNLTFKSMPNRD